MKKFQILLLVRFIMYHFLNSVELNTMTSYVAACVYYFPYLQMRVRVEEIEIGLWYPSSYMTQPAAQAILNLIWVSIQRQYSMFPWTPD